MKPRMNRVAVMPRTPASLLKGFYRRVSRQLGVDSSYVLRVARGECRSRNVQEAMERELRRVFHQTRKD